MGDTPWTVMTSKAPAVLKDVPSCDFISHSVSKSVGCVSQWPSDQTRTSIGAEFAEEEKQEAKALQIPANCLPSICQILNPRANT